MTTQDVLAPLSYGRQYDAIDENSVVTELDHLATIREEAIYASFQTAVQIAEVKRRKRAADVPVPVPVPSRPSFDWATLGTYCASFAWVLFYAFAATGAGYVALAMFVTEQYVFIFPAVIALVGFLVLSAARLRIHLIEHRRLADG